MVHNRFCHLSGWGGVSKTVPRPNFKRIRVKKPTLVQDAVVLSIFNVIYCSTLHLKIGVIGGTLRNINLLYFVTSDFIGHRNK